MTLPFGRLFPPSNNIITFDFFDIISGTGIKKLYAGDVNSSSAGTPGTYILQASQSYSDVGSTDGGNNGTLDIDFDILINRPITIEGEGIINVPALLFNTGANATLSPTITARVRKWDGSTETTLVSGTTIITSLVSQDDVVYEMGAIKVNIPKTLFKKGETLRLTIESASPGANHSIVIAHDGLSRIGVPSDSITLTGTWEESTALTMQLPIAIDI